MKMVDRQLQRMEQVPRPVGSRTQPCCNVSFLVDTSETQKARTKKPADKNMILFGGQLIEIEEWTDARGLLEII